MNEENGKHEFNFFLDKQLQQKLLEANQELIDKELSLSVLSNLGNNNSNGPQSTTSKSTTGANQQNNSNKLHKYSECVHVCGWCPDPNTVYRKTETDPPPTRSRGSIGYSRESIYSRDSRIRPQNAINYVFRHYSDPRRYIEEYRKEHACIDSTNSSATKNEFLEMRRFYAYNQYSSLAVGSNNSLQNPYVPQPQLDPAIQIHETGSKLNHQPPSLHYTNKREQKRNTISATLNSKNQHQYKLSQTPTNKPGDFVKDYTEEYIESLESMKKIKRPSSAREKSTPTVNGLGLQKSMATKISVPSSNLGVKGTRATSSGNNQENISHANLAAGHKNGQQMTTMRMLDTLTCTASNGADRQLIRAFVISACGK